MTAGNHSNDRRRFLEGLGASGAVFLIQCSVPATPGKDDALDEAKTHRWGMLLDATKCIGCTACMRGCRAENDVPEGRTRTWIERYRLFADGRVEVDAPLEPRYEFPQHDEETSQSFFVPKMCNHCTVSVCSQVCPVGASYETPDGVVLVDAERCVGCGYCVQACPYGTRFINPKTHVADKCTLCYHRITRGLVPVCVAVCPTGARLFGDLADPDSEISQLVRQLRPRTLRPELGTGPNVFYVGLDKVVI